MIKELNLSGCDNLITICGNAFAENTIRDIKFPSVLKTIEETAFYKNQIEEIDLSQCDKLGRILKDAFSDNPLEEIKILGNIEIEYDNYYKEDKWNKFARYYNDNNKTEGDYKLENYEWQWYPL
jgi:hypothetical protein